MNALELREVSKTRGLGAHATRALAAVTLKAAAGEIVLLEGPSGSGKTTLLAIAAGLLTADQGEVEVAGATLGRMSAAALRRWRAQQVGFVFQRPRLLEGLSVLENVVLAATLAGRARALATQEAARLLEELGIEALAARRPSTLSGGEEQRVSVARSLVHRPALVLADEPTASLDWASGQAVASHLQRLARERGAAVVLSTHDLRLEPYADRRVRLVDGSIR
jgi:putative ABC transport system ATP-binding protein